MVLNKCGLVAGWNDNSANVYDANFQPIVAQFSDEMTVLTDRGFHLRTGDPPNMKICEPNTWNCCLMIETVGSMLHTVCHIGHMAHRVCPSYLGARLAFCMAAFNILAQWHGLVPDEHGRGHLSIAHFSR